MTTTASMRRTALLAVPVVLVGGFWLLAGDRAGAGAALGVAMVTLFFAGGRAPMFLANSTPAGQLLLLIALGYVLRVVLLLAVLRGLADAHWLDRDALATAVILGTLAWTGYLAARHLTSHQPTLVIDEVSPSQARAGAFR